MPFMELATPDDGLIHVFTQWNEKPLIQQVPGARYKAKLKHWTVPKTYAACVQLRGVFKAALESGPLVVEWAWNERRNRIDRAMVLRTAVETENVYHPNLYGFQNADVEFMYVAGSGVLGNSAGCGKTPSLVVLLEVLPEGLPALVTTPNSVKLHWGEHVQDWGKSLTPYVIDGPAAQRRAMIADAREDPRAVVIVNWEALRTFSRLAPYGSVKLKRCRECDPDYGDDIRPSACHVHPKELNGFGFRTVIADEIHRAAEPKTQQSRSLWALASEPSVAYAWGATGTMIKKHPLDAWSPMHAVVPDEYPVRSKFGDRYALMSWNEYGGLDVVGLRPDTKDEFFAFFDPRYRRVTKELVLPQLPPKVFPPTRVVQQTPGQRRMTKELDAAMTTTDEEGNLIVTPAVIARHTRKLQLAVASLRVVDKPDPDDPTTWVMALCEPSPVLDDLAQVFEEFEGQQAIVMAEHRQLIDLESVRLAKMKIPHGVITGNVSNAAREEQRKQFQAGHLPYMLFTAKAGGVGLNMSAASLVVVIQRPSSMIDYLQGIDRAHRPGAERHASTTIVHIAAQGTVEMEKEQDIREKMARLEEINRDRLLRTAAGLDTSDLDVEETNIMHSRIGPNPFEDTGGEW